MSTTPEEHWRYRAARELSEKLMDAELAGWMKGVRFGVLITVGFIVCLAGLARLVVAIWELCR